MKKFNFNLQKLLEYKQSIEDKKMAELAFIRAEYERELRMLLKLVAEKDLFREDMKRKLSACDSEEIKQAHKYLEGLYQIMKTQENTVACVAKRKDAKMCEVLEAAKERKSLERLKEHKRVAHRREFEHQEQKFLDDIACIRGAHRHHEIGFGSEGLG